MKGYMNKGKRLLLNSCSSYGSGTQTRVSFSLKTNDNLQLHVQNVHMISSQKSISKIYMAFMLGKDIIQNQYDLSAHLVNYFTPPIFQNNSLIRKCNFSPLFCKILLKPKIILHERCLWHSWQIPRLPYGNIVNFNITNMTTAEHNPVLKVVVFLHLDSIFRSCRAIFFLLFLV